MISHRWCIPLAVALGCGGGSAPEPATPQPIAAEEARPAEPHPEVMQALQRIEARLERVEDREETIRALEDRLGAVEQRLEQPIAQPPPRPRPSRVRPDPSAVYAVPIDGAPFRGPTYAKVTIVKAFEFACPYCNLVRPTLDQLRQEYGKNLKIVYKHYVVHPTTATRPAQAVCAANMQGKFKRLEALLWSEGFDAGRNFSAENIDRLARKAGLRMKRWRKDMEGPCQDIVRNDQREMAQLGTRGTPAFYINGRYLSGAQPIDKFRRLIDEELARANERIADGTPLKKYYGTWVLERGLKKLAP